MEANTEGMKSILLYIWKKLRNKSYRKIIWVTKSCAQVNSLLEGMVMIFYAISNNISVISWPSVLLVEKTTDLPQVTDKFIT